MSPYFLKLFNVLAWVYLLIDNINGFVLYCIASFCSNSDCGWKIEARQGYVVRLYVSRIDLEESVDCSFDNITLFDGGKFWSTRQYITYIVASRDSWRVVRELQVARSRLEQRTGRLSACCTCLQRSMQSANELIRGTVCTLATNTKLMHWPMPHL